MQVPPLSSICRNRLHESVLYELADDDQSKYGSPNLPNRALPSLPTLQIMITDMIGGVLTAQALLHVCQRVVKWRRQRNPILTASQSFIARRIAPNIDAPGLEPLFTCQMRQGHKVETGRLLKQRFK